MQELVADYQSPEDRCWQCHKTMATKQLSYCSGCRIGALVKIAVLTDKLAGAALVGPSQARKALFDATSRKHAWRHDEYMCAALQLDKAASMAGLGLRRRR